MNIFRLSMSSMLWVFFSLLLSGCSGNSSPTSNQQMGGAVQGTQLSLSQQVSTIAGMAPGSSDGTGTTARFNRIYAITCDGSNLYVADYRDHIIRKVVIATGAVTAIAGTRGVSGSTDATGAVATFNS